MNTKDINTRIETSRKSYQTMIEKVEREYKEETTQAVHDFIESAREYFPEGLIISGYCAGFHYDRAKVWNNDGKRVCRTFIVEVGRPRYYICKLQERSTDDVAHVSKVIRELCSKIGKFEEVEGGSMFEYHRLHFRGTHTFEDLGLKDLPQYVIDEMIKFGWWPEFADIVPFGFDYDEIQNTWNYDEFLTAAAAVGGSYDVFMCMETGKYYYPSKGKLSEVYMDNLQKNIDFWMR